MGWGGGLCDQEYRFENTDFRRERVVEITELEVRKSSLKSVLSLTLCVNLDHHLPFLGFRLFLNIK